ncbi:MAG: transcription antitermination factor NusB [Phycisphaerae bacterium]
MTTQVQPTDTARFIAAKVLNQWERSRAGLESDSSTQPIFAEQILDKFLGNTNQKQRATDLTFGTIRNLTAIDLVLANIADTPPKRIASNLINIVRIGIYELVYCPITPPYSIINEAAQNVKSVAGQKQVGFVNAVLRKTLSKIVNRQAELSQANPRKTLVQNNQCGCEFAKLFLPDPVNASVDYLSSVFSLPRWLVNVWIEQYSPEDAREICLASNRRPSIYIRPNTLKTTAYELAEILHQAKIDCDIAPDEYMIRLTAQKDISKLPGYDDGLFTVQDMAAAKPLQHIKLNQNSLILDLCSAPGTKTTQLAEITDDKAKIFATDIDAARLKLLSRNINRLGIKSVEMIPYENLKEHIARSGLLDFILLDVPCSNTGVLAKRPEVRHRIKPKSAENLVKIQNEIINFAVALLKPEGRICYTTCSILKQENQQIVECFLSSNPNFALESELLTLPACGKFDHDGNYFAILKKT